MLDNATKALQNPFEFPYDFNFMLSWFVIVGRAKRTPSRRF
jgi:hypothetical protein